MSITNDPTIQYLDSLYYNHVTRAALGQWVSPFADPNKPPAELTELMSYIISISRRNSIGGNRVFRFEIPDCPPKILREVSSQPNMGAILKRICRSSVTDHFAISKYYPLQYLEGDEVQTDYLLIGDFYLYGNLRDYLSTSCSTENDIEKCAIVLNYMQQMFSILTGLTEQNIGFPDLKLDNFLVDDFGRLRISDVKTLFLSDDLAKVTSIDKQFSPKYIPEDLFKKVQSGHKDFKATFNYRKLMTYQLGLMVYYMLVPEDIKLDVTNLNFDQAIFKSAIGQVFQEIIKEFTQEKEEARLDFDAAKEFFANKMLHATIAAKNLVNDRVEDELRQLEPKIAIYQNTLIGASLTQLKLEVLEKSKNSDSLTDHLECYSAVRDANSLIDSVNTENKFLPTAEKYNCQHPDLPSNLPLARAVNNVAIEVLKVETEKECIKLDTTAKRYEFIPGVKRIINGISKTVRVEQKAAKTVPEHMECYSFAKRTNKLADKIGTSEFENAQEEYWRENARSLRNARLAKAAYVTGATLVCASLFVTTMVLTGGTAGVFWAAGIAAHLVIAAFHYKVADMVINRVLRKKVAIEAMSDPKNFRVSAPCQMYSHPQRPTYEQASINSTASCRIAVTAAT